MSSLTKLHSRFLKDTSGNYAMITGLMMLPLMGALSLAVDYAEMTRQKQAMVNALDATCVATAKQFLDGATESEAKAYAAKFFAANLGPASQHTTTLTTIVPTESAPREDVQCTSTIAYKPYLRPAFLMLYNGDPTTQTLNFAETTNVKIQNTVEVSLVLDNSGSMDERAKTSSPKRIDVLKQAASALVDQLSARGKLMKKVINPVQFSLVPFSASVNVGKTFASASWIDTGADSPIHYENFNTTSTMYVDGNTNKQIKMSSGKLRKIGTAWPVAEQNSIVTRLSLYNELKQWTTSAKTATNVVGAWEGCVEARPYPYDITDDAATTANPATLFVPWFYPDNYYNDWFTNYDTSLSYADQQRDLRKYFTPVAYNKDTSGFVGLDDGPNGGCSTTPITPLTDISTTAGATFIKTKINAMQPTGNTNVPEGMAWGWRTLSSAEPFTEGRPEISNGNDKVLIVLTDGANTYTSLKGYTDPEPNKSTYAAYGFINQMYNGGSKTRLFLGQDTGFSTSTYTAANLSTAMDTHFKQLCNNVKNSNVMVMTVAVDLKTTDADELKQINLLRDCASNSRFKKNSDGTPKKLFWNSTSATLTDDFKAIGDELSNLRIVG